MIFPYEGPEALRAPLLKALERVVDPELAMSIVDIGLVYGLKVCDGGTELRMTMTSAACPVADMIVCEVEQELARVLPGGSTVDVQLCWEPAWSSDRMSERARRFMGW